MIPTDINVFKSGYKVEVYRDLSQWMACNASVKTLQAEMKATEYGDGYKNLLQSRINAALADIAKIEAKYAGGIEAFRE